ncbi:hypothetical protein [Hymenobacter sp. HDW8]|uniref:hypothetical protein n=1 Tax=Hymenobacter sp. HDW8 TaxID=2714932 RepID=UPI001407CBB3|nr:hypothetical protein [Hymenobacter sp. HDW8]QIL78356.1 hypothetical protein G7064_21310 [Hymenobacter sp. HDW8]
MPSWKTIVLVSSVLLVDIVAYLLLAMLSMSYGDVTHLLEDEAYQRFERSVTVGWWLWWGINVGTLAVLLYRLFKQHAAAPSAPPMD